MGNELLFVFSLFLLLKILQTITQLSKKEKQSIPMKYKTIEFRERKIPEDIQEKRHSIKPLPHILFYGPPGVGKTTLIRLIKNRFFELYKLENAKYIEMPAGYIDSMARLRTILIGLTPYSIFFIDEIHGLDKKIEEALYTPMQDNIFSDENGNRITLPPFTLMGATTEPAELNEPLFNRFKITVPLEPWPLEKLSEIDPDKNPEEDWNAYKWQTHAKQLVDTILKALNVSFEPLVVDSAKIESARRTADQTPRTWKSIIQIAKYVAKAKNKRIVDRDDVIETCQMLGINEDGLWKPDIRMLETLYKIEGHRTAMRRAADLAKVDMGQLRNMIIPRLMRKELISITSRGIGLTEKGIEYYETKLVN